MTPEEVLKEQAGIPVKCSINENAVVKWTDAIKAIEKYASLQEAKPNIVKFQSELITFDVFRKLYPGTKRGNKTEFDNFCKKHKDWKEVLPYLTVVIKEQIAVKEAKKQKKEFVPEWKNLQTWINQRCWEEEIAKTDTVKPNVMKGSFL